MKKTLITLALAVITMAAGAQGPQAKTSCGVLEGTYESGIKVFRGVPFAQPPGAALEGATARQAVDRREGGQAVRTQPDAAKPLRRHELRHA